MCARAEAPPRPLSSSTAHALRRALAAGGGTPAADRRRADAAVETALAVARAIGGEGAGIGPFRFVRSLGAGATGQVHLARVARRAGRLRVGRLVAVKVLHPALCASSDARRRFEREARLGTRVRAPTVVRVHGCFRCDGPDGARLLLVMEPVAGQPLDELLRRRRRVPLATSLAIVADLARALRAVHRAGLVHRDVKPSNVVRRPDGRACLLDLGLASAQRAAERITRPSHFVGTLAYAAPERLADPSAPPDPRADLYALGVLWVDLLAGLPSRRSSIGSAWDRLPRSTPVAYRAILRRLLAHNPSQRFSSAGALLRAMRRVAPASALRGPQPGDPGSLASSLDLELQRAYLLRVGGVVRITVEGAGAVRALLDEAERRIALVCEHLPYRSRARSAHLFAVLRPGATAGDVERARAVVGGAAAGRPACLAAVDPTALRGGAQRVVERAVAVAATRPLLVVGIAGPARAAARAPSFFDRARRIESAPRPRRRTLPREDARLLRAARALDRPFEAGELARTLGRRPIAVAQTLAHLVRTTDHLEARGRLFLVRS